MAVNEFKLAQSTTQIQDLFNLLMANGFSQNYMLVTNGSKGVKFVRGLHASDNTITLTNDNAIGVNVESIRSALSLPRTEDFELKSNKANIISNQSTDNQYPSAKAVYSAIASLGIKVYEESFASIDTLINTFKNRGFSSQTLYVANIISEIHPQPCMFIQYGNIQTGASKITLMLFYKDTWRRISGEVVGASVNITSDVSYDLSTLAPASSLTSLAPTTYVDEKITEAKSYADTKLEEAKTYLDELILGTIDGEY